MGAICLLSVVYAMSLYNQSHEFYKAKLLDEVQVNEKIAIKTVSKTKTCMIQFTYPLFFLLSRMEDVFK